jgi:hypothetical protein
MKDLSQENAPLLTVQGDLDADVSLVDNQGGTLYLLTNRDAPNRRLVTVDAANPGPARWRDLIPERQQVLTVHSGSGYLFAEYMVDATARVEQFDYEGKRCARWRCPALAASAASTASTMIPPSTSASRTMPSRPLSTGSSQRAAPSASIAPRRRRSNRRITSPSSASTRARTAPGCRSSSATARG